jgi:hypothetical protein
MSLACMVAYFLVPNATVLLLFAAVIFSVHSGTERIINHLDGNKQETSHGRRRKAAITIVDGIEFTGPEMQPGDMVLDALLIVRVQSPGAPKSRVTVYRSAGLDDVVETGMLQIEAARDMAPLGSG